MLPRIADLAAFLLRMTPLTGDSDAFLLLMVTLTADLAAFLPLMTLLIGDSDVLLLLLTPLLGDLPKSPRDLLAMPSKHNFVIQKASQITPKICTYVHQSLHLAILVCEILLKSFIRRCSPQNSF